MLFLLVVGIAVTYGGFSVYGDQTSGVAGRAKVSECEGGGRYDRAIRCRGSWLVGGDSVLDGGELALGRIEGAGYDDVGRTVDVRIHGTDHATVPSLVTPIVLWGLGAPLSLLCLFGLWRWWRERI